jgi:phospholipase C
MESRTESLAMKRHRLGLGVALASFVAAAACGSSSSTQATGTKPGGGSPTNGTGGTGGVDTGGGATVGGGDEGPGADGGGGSGGGGFVPGQTPIKHVVIVVKENHTFDNYFGSFPGAEGTTQCTTSMGTIACPHAPDKTPRDLCHEHSCALADWNGGKMDGWDKTTGTSVNGDNLAYAQYQEADIPNYWAYAKAFTLGDHFFANVLGPSFPGHTFVLAAQAGWADGNPNTDVTHPFWGCDQSSTTLVSVMDNGSCNEKQVFPCFDIPALPDVLPQGTDWKFYGSNFYVLPEIWSMFNAVKSIRNGPGWSNVVNASTFDADVDAGKLPAVSWLVDQDLADEHPNVGGVCAGENWTVGHINHIMQNPKVWAETAILFTMDDFGGWYDHVAPPRQYPGCNASQPYGLGFRLPLIIISPYAKAHYVFKDVAEQASIPRFVEQIFGATKKLSDIDPAAQDGQANDLLGAFDFTQAPLPPLVLQTRTCN